MASGSVTTAFFLYRYLPIGYHHFLMILIAVVIVLLSLLLAGCSSSSPLIPGIFLISFYYTSYTPTYSPTQVDPGVTAAIANLVGDTSLEVRVGYFGICLTTNGESYLCSNNATLLAEQISIDEDPLNLIWVAETFKNDVVFPYLLIVAVVMAFITFVILGTFPGWRPAQRGESVDVKPFPTRAVSQVTLALIFVAAVFVLVSVLWQHTASVAGAQVAQDFGNGSVKSGVGTAAMALGWVGFGVLVTVVIALLLMVLSVGLLTDIVED